MSDSSSDSDLLEEENDYSFITPVQRQRMRQAYRQQVPPRKESPINKKYTKKEDGKYEKTISYSKPRKLMII